MKITEKIAKELFKEKYPSGIGYDFRGRKMILENYNMKNMNDNFNIDHILPVSKGGKTIKENLECTNIITNEIKGDKTTWEDNGITFQVKRVKGNKDAHIVVKLED